MPRVMPAVAARRATTGARREAVTPATAGVAADIVTIQVFAVFLPVKITVPTRILIVLMRHRNVAAAVRRQLSAITVLLSQDGLNVGAVNLWQSIDINFSVNRCFEIECFCLLSRTP